MFFQVKPIKLKHTVSLRLVLILFFLIIGLAPMLIQNKIMLGEPDRCADSGYSEPVLDPEQ